MNAFVAAGYAFRYKCIFFAPTAERRYCIATGKCVKEGKCSVQLGVLEPTPLFHNFFYDFTKSYNNLSALVKIANLQPSTLKPFLINKDWFKEHIVL